MVSTRVASDFASKCPIFAQFAEALIKFTTFFYENQINFQNDLKDDVIATLNQEIR